MKSKVAGPGKNTLVSRSDIIASHHNIHYDNQTNTSQEEFRFFYFVFLFSSKQVTSQVKQKRMGATWENSLARKTNTLRVTQHLALLPSVWSPGPPLHPHVMTATTGTTLVHCCGFQFFKIIPLALTHQTSYTELLIVRFRILKKIIKNSNISAD